MDLRSLLCLILPTLATLHLSIAEDSPLVDGQPSPLEAEGEQSLSNLSPEDKKRWSNFHSWGKRWGNFASWGKRTPTSLFPAKKWSNNAFTSWGKRDLSPEQKRNWNQFVTWGKRNWHTVSSRGKRAHDQADKRKWNSLTSSWGKRAGWDSGFTSWGKRAVDVTDKLMKLFDENDDGVLDGKEVGNFLTWLGSLSKELPPSA